MTDIVVIDQKLADTVVLPAQDQTVAVEVPGLVYVVADGVQGPEGIPGPEGPQGPAGPAGPDGTSAVTKVAAGAIGGQRVVIGNTDGTVRYADATDLTDLGRVLGVTQTAAADGEPVNVIVRGYYEEPTWTWNTTLPLYVGSNGLITQTAPTVGFSQIIGFAETPTRIFIRMREPIALN